MRKILVYLFFLFGCSSVNIDIIQTGPWFPSTKPDKIEIYTDRNKIKKAFGGIAIFHTSTFPYSKKEAEKNLVKIRKKAAKIGADAIIYALESYNKNYNIGEIPEYYISALAIKYVDKNENK